MKTTCLLTTSVILVFLLSIVSQSQPAPHPKVWEAEAKALAAINAAPDATAKLTAAEEFAKKYPKSAALPQLSQELALEIGRLSDANQKLALADRFEKAFTDEKGLTHI